MIPLTQKRFQPGSGMETVDFPGGSDSDTVAMIFEDKIGIKLYVSGALGAIVLYPYWCHLRKRGTEIHRSENHLPFRRNAFSGSSPAGDRSRRADRSNKVIGALGSNPSPYVLTLVVFLLCCVMTNFMSNTATTALIVPICLSIA